MALVLRATKSHCFSSKEGKKALSKDEWRLLGPGLLAALPMELALWPIFAYNIQMPKILQYAICGAIAVAVFLLSEYMQGKIALTQAKKEIVESGKKTEYTVGSMNAQLANSYYWYRFT